MMSIFEPNMVDQILTDSDGVVLMVIADATSWVEGDVRHLQALADKVNCYLGVVDSGEIFEIYPHSQGRQICISIYFIDDPTSACREVLNQSEEVASTYGVKIKWQIGLPSAGL